MKTKFVLPILIALIVAMAMTFLYFQSRSPKTDLHTDILEQLEMVEYQNFELNESLFQTASRKTLDYDMLSTKQQQLSQVFQSLINGAYGLGQFKDATIDAVASQLGAAIKEKNKLIEHFKRDNALMNNSLQYYPRLAREVITLSNTDASYMPYHELAHRVMYFSFNRGDVWLEEANAMIVKLKQDLASHTDTDSSKHLFLTNFLGHSEIIVNGMDTQKERALLDAETPIIMLQGALHDAYMNYYIAQTDGAEKYSQIMFVATLLLISSIAYVLILLAKSALELAKEKENALAASLSKSAFLANMSHEIRTPLTAIIGFGESTLDNNQTGEERLSASRAIVRNAKHLVHVINEILDISKIESGKLGIEKLPTNIFELLNDIESIARLQAESKGLYFGIRHKFPLPESILTDPIRLKQILLNLTNNAVKFTERGQVEIVVSFDSSCDALKFSVVDSGIGLSQEQIEKLFTPFSQADSSTTRKYGGTGLGLHISKFLVEMLGGALTVESVPGLGSRFEFTVDAGALQEESFVNDAPSITVLPHQEISSALPPRLQGNILLAEDNPDNQELISFFIRKTGAAVTVAEDGLQAFHHALKRKFDLILMDMQMPVMGGLQVTRELRQKGYDKPIVALTANATADDVRACREAGCEGFLSKPVDWKNFYEALSEHLDVAQNIFVEPEPLTSLILENEPELRDLVEKFLNALPEQLELLDVAYNKRDLQTLDKQLHKLKGSGGNLGYPQLTTLAAQMERQASQQEIDKLAISFRQLHRLVAQMIAGSPTAAKSV